MTDRINGFFVTLDSDLRAEDAEIILSAVRLMRGVIDVRDNVAEPASHVAYMRARRDLTQRLFESLAKEGGDG